MRVNDDDDDDDDDDDGNAQIANSFLIFCGPYHVSCVGWQLT